jgi:hypothetical protein
MTDTPHKNPESCTGSDTPETDANDEAWAYNMQYDTFSSLMDAPLPWDEFARKLERERNEAVNSCHIWQKGHSALVSDRDGWKRLAVEQEKEIEEWKVEVERWRSLAQGWRKEAVDAIKDTRG